MYINYIVGINETLDNIASKFNVSTQNIINANKLTNPNIAPGSKIMIPLTNNNYNYYQVKNGESLYDVSRKTTTNLELLAEVNGLLTYDYLYPGQILMIPKKNIKFYKTKQGDTIDMIAKQYGTKISNIISNNQNIYLMEEQLIAIKD